MEKHRDRERTRMSVEHQSRGPSSSHAKLSGSRVWSVHQLRHHQEFVGNAESQAKSQTCWVGICIRKTSPGDSCARAWSVLPQVAQGRSCNVPWAAFILLRLMVPTFHVPCILIPGHKVIKGKAGTPTGVCHSGLTRLLWCSISSPFIQKHI